MCLQSVWLWNNYDKTTGTFPKNQCQFPPPPPAELHLRGGKEWRIMSYCHQTWSTLTQPCFVMNKLHFLPPTSFLPNTQDLTSSYLGWALKKRQGLPIANVWWPRKDHYVTFMKAQKAQQAGDCMWLNHKSHTSLEECRSGVNRNVPDFLKHSWVNGGEDHRF